MSLAIVFLCLAVVIGIYFYNNPLSRTPWFLWHELPAATRRYIDTVELRSKSAH